MFSEAKKWVDLIEQIDHVHHNHHTHLISSYIFVFDKLADVSAMFGIFPPGWETYGLTVLQSVYNLVGNDSCSWSTTHNFDVHVITRKFS